MSHGNGCLCAVLLLSVCVCTECVIHTATSVPNRLLCFCSSCWRWHDESQKATRGVSLNCYPAQVCWHEGCFDFFCIKCTLCAHCMRLCVHGTKMHHAQGSDGLLFTACVFVNNWFFSLVMKCCWAADLLSLTVACSLVIILHKSGSHLPRRRNSTHMADLKLMWHEFSQHGFRAHVCRAVAAQRSSYRC